VCSSDLQQTVLHAEMQDRLLYIEEMLIRYQRCLTKVHRTILGN